MRKTLIFATLLLAGHIAFSQSGKEIKTNKIKSITTWQNDKDDSPAKVYKDTYEVFDKNGNTTTKIDYKKDGSIKSRQQFKFDKDNNKTEELEYDGNNVVITHKTYAYNAFGKRTEEKEFAPNGELTRKTTYTLNASGDKTAETVTDAKGAMLKKVEYTYNSRNLKTQRTTSNKAKQVELIKKWTYEYY